MHYIHTVRTYIFTYIYLSRYLHLSVCLSIPKARYNISLLFFSSSYFIGNSGVSSFFSFSSFSGYR